MFLSLVQPANADSPIDLSPLGKLRRSSAVQSLKADLPISKLTQPPKLILTSDLNPSNADSPILKLRGNPISLIEEY